MPPILPRALPAAACAAGLVSSLAATLAATLSATLSATAWADIDLVLGNGDKVTGEIAPQAEVETYRFRVPQGAKFTVQIKAKAGFVVAGTLTGPSGGMTNLGPDTAVKLAGVVSAETGEYVLDVRAGGPAGGKYKLSVKWTNPAATTETVTLGGGDRTVTRPVEFAGRATVTVTSPAAGTVRGRLAEWARGDDTVGTFDPGPADAPKHVVTTGQAAFTDDYVFRIANAGSGAGDVTVQVRPRAPKPSRRKLDLTDANLANEGDGSSLVGDLIGPGGGNVGVDDPLSPVDGAGVSVPPGSVQFPTPFVIGSGVEILPPDPNQQGAGPTVFFGPEGQNFSQPVLVTIPFDPLAVGGDPAKLQIFTRDAQGNVTLVPPPYEIDAVAGTVSFPASHFSSFRALARSSSPADLTGDGIDDLVVFAGMNDEPRILVFAGGPGVRDRGAMDEDDAVAVIRPTRVPGAPDVGPLAPRWAVGDHDGDGDADLVVLQNPGEFADPFAKLYLGGKQFARNAARDRFVKIAAATGQFYSVAMGDVDGDGRADIFLSDLTGGAAAGGRVFFLAGTADPDATDAEAAPQRVSGTTFGFYGTKMLCADVDGDGLSDFAASAPGSSVNFVEIVPGSSLFGARFATEASEVLTGTVTADGSFGFEMAAGDIDRDGRAELFVGIPGDSAVLLRDGGALGSTRTLDTRVAAGDGALGSWIAVIQVPAAAPYGPAVVAIGSPLLRSVDIVNAGALSLYRRNTALTWDPVGFVAGEGGADGLWGTVHPAIDWDGDGFQDLVVGEPGFDGPSSAEIDAGRILVAFGSALDLTDGTVQISGRGGANLGAR
ncbi:MAG: hypothetical protein HMLKMBBP_01382 [Planctomycetes bacterium]|nr:hypothetical protein [Planctomycetota bacterium]